MEVIDGENKEIKVKVDNFLEFIDKLVVIGEEILIVGFFFIFVGFLMSFSFRGKLLDVFIEVFLINLLI